MGDTWFLDEVFVTIGGKLHYLWGTVKLTKIIEKSGEFIS